MQTTTSYLARGHENLGRLLLVLESHLARPLSGEEPDVELMHAIVGYAVDYVERQHNPVEQLVFARLERRARWLHALFDAHARELGEVRANMARFFEQLERARIDARFGRDELSRTGKELVAGLRRRLVIEDTEFLPAAAQALDAEDWRSIEATLRTRGIREEPQDDERFESEFAKLAREAGCDCTYA